MNGRTGNTERTRVAVQAGCIGILCNLLLFGGKLALGLWGNSISIMADAFNNLSDAGSSVIALLGSRMAGREADAEHPFGHGRIEYIAAFLVAFLLTEVGLKTLESSVRKLMHREALHFSGITLLLLFMSIVVKLGLALYYRTVARRIDSSVFRASASDSFQDMAITAATVLSLGVFRLTGWNIDAAVGLLLSLFVIWNGISILRETVAPLIGESNDPKLSCEIREIVEKHRGVYGSHDLVLHQYGPERYMGSIHVELDGAQSLRRAHALADHIERQIREETGVMLVIHTDPVQTDAEARDCRKRTERLLRAIRGDASLHDFRLRHTEDGREFEFDILLPWGLEKEEEQRITRELEKGLAESLQEKLRLRLHIDHPYTSARSDAESVEAERAFAGIENRRE